MATKAESLAEKTRRALEARQSGSIEKFIQTSQQERVNQAAAIKLNLSTPSPFAGLARNQNCLPTSHECIENRDREAVIAAPQARVKNELHEISIIDAHGAPIEEEVVSAPVARPMERQSSLAPTPEPIASIQQPVTDALMKKMDPVPGSGGAASSTISRFKQISKMGRDRRFGNEAVVNNGHNPNSGEIVRPLTKAGKEDPPWNFMDTPAGSKYSPKEWADARALGNNTVIEVRNEGESALLVIPRCPEGSMEKTLTDRKGGYVETRLPPIKEECTGRLSPMFAQIWDGCLLLSPKAKTTHPQAVSAELDFNTEDKILGLVRMRIVRPESHRNNEALAWMYGMKGDFMAGAVGMRGVRAEIKDQADPSDYSSEYEEGARHVRGREYRGG
jgi:hypothetical protein